MSYFWMLGNQSKVDASFSLRSWFKMRWINVPSTPVYILYSSTTRLINYTLAYNHSYFMYNQSLKTDNFPLMCRNQNNPQLLLSSFIGTIFCCIYMYFGFLGWTMALYFLIPYTLSCCRMCINPLLKLVPYEYTFHFSISYVCSEL